MQVEIDMDAVFAAELDCRVDIFEFVIAANLEQVAGISPTKVRQRQTSEIETPFRDQREIAFFERRITIGALDAFLGQVKSAPARQAPGSWAFGFGGAERGGRGGGRNRPGTGGVGELWSGATAACR